MNSNGTICQILGHIPTKDATTLLERGIILESWKIYNSRSEGAPVLYRFVLMPDTLGSFREA